MGNLDDVRTSLKKAERAAALIMIDSGNEQAQSAKVNPTQKQIPTSSVVKRLAIPTVLLVVLLFIMQSLEKFTRKKERFNFAAVH
jgi:hypothetical protein